MGRVIKDIDLRSRQDNLQATAALKKQGIQYLKPTPKAIDELRRTIISANRKIEREGNLSADKVEKLNAYLIDFRNKNQ